MSTSPALHSAVPVAQFGRWHPRCGIAFINALLRHCDGSPIRKLRYRGAMNPFRSATLTLRCDPNKIAAAPAEDGANLTEAQRAKRRRNAAFLNIELAKVHRHPPATGLIKLSFFRRVALTW